MRLTRFRHKGLRDLHADDNAKGAPPAMADKLRKLLFALETAHNLDQVSRFPGWKLHPSEGWLERILEPDSYGKLAIDFPLRQRSEQRQRNRLDRLPLGGLKCP